MFRYSVICLFLTIIALMPRSSFGSEVLACPQVHATTDLKAHNEYHGIALTYSPLLAINGTVRHYPDHVIIEVFLPGADHPKSQALRLYHDPSGLSQPFGRDELHNLGLQTIYQNYGELVDRAIVAKVIEVEKSLSLDRQSTFLARNPRTETAVGFVRIFDGSFYSEGVRSVTNFGLPLEKILKSMNKSTTLVSELRAQNKHVFEIGKYFISKDLDPHDTKLVRSDIIRFVIDFLETRGDDELHNSYFLAHVASRPNRIANQRYFGFEVAPREKSRGLDANEDLLYIRGDQLLRKLREVRSSTMKVQTN